MKKIKRILITLVVLMLTAVALAYAYKDKLIKELVTQYNEAYNITISYNKVSLNLFQDFPSLNVAISDVLVMHDEVKDSLFFAKKVALTTNIKDLFKKELNKITLKDILIADAKLKLLIQEDGKSTFDVHELKENKNVSDSKTETPIIALQEYAIKNTTIIYEDKKSVLHFDLTNLNHTGKGDFTANKLDLSTKTQADAMTLALGGVNYFNKAKITLDAVLGIDLEQMQFTFKENKATINDLLLNFDGLIKINDNSQDYDITFNAPKARFKNLLSLVPNAYSSSFKGIKATGNADFSGSFKGVLSDNEFPKYQLKIKTDKASFQYPDLPKAVEAISFDGLLASTANDDALLDIKNLAFTIAEDTFSANGKISKLLSNPTVDAALKGKLNLANLSQAYPMPAIEKLDGLLQADIVTSFSQKALEKNQFEHIKAQGNASLTDFAYTANDMKPLNIKNAALAFTTKKVVLENFEAKTGKSDIKAQGKINNLLAFLFNDKKLKGDFNIKSNHFEVNDFLVKDTNTTNKETANEPLKIPDFLDIKTTFDAKNVVYDNITMQDVSGTAFLKEQKAILANTKAKVFNGSLSFDGNIDTKPKKPNFDLDMKIDKFDIAQSFQTLETLQKIAPIAKALAGKYNSTFKLKGNLTPDLLPDLNTLSGGLFAKLLVDNIDKNKLPLLNSLSAKLNFIDFSKVDLSDLVAIVDFKDGKVNVKPFDLKYQDITMHITGSHSFDESLSYTMTMDVPAKYLGDKAVRLLAKLGNMDKDTIKIPLKSNISGFMLKPNVQVDFKSALKTLSNRVIAYQKQRLTAAATEQVTNAVNEAVGNTVGSTVGNAVDNVLGNVLGNSNENNNTTQPKDSTATNTANTSSPKDSIKNAVQHDVEDGVKDVLNGFFKKKKK